MPICRVLLSFSERADISVGCSTLWTLRLHPICLIEATLVERVLAHKVHPWQIQAPTTRGAPRGLENSRLIAQIVHLFSLGLGFSTVAFDETTVLDSVSRPNCSHWSITYIGDLFSLPLDGVTEILLDHTHRCNSIRAQCLYHL